LYVFPRQALLFLCWCQSLNFGSELFCLSSFHIHQVIIVFVFILVCVINLGHIMECGLGCTLLYSTVEMFRLVILLVKLFRNEGILSFYLIFKYSQLFSVSFTCIDLVTFQSLSQVLVYVVTTQTSYRYLYTLLNNNETL
jgi:hypothetical protein